MSVKNNSIIEKLVQFYPTGIKKHNYYYGRSKENWASRLSHEEIKEILNLSGRDQSNFENLVSTDPNFRKFIKEQEKKLLLNWFQKLTLSDSQRTQKAHSANIQKERRMAEKKRIAVAREQRRLEAEKRKAHAKLLLAKRREEQRAAAAKKKEAEKAKIVKEAQKRLKLLKELELSPKQELLLNKLLK